MADTAIMPLTDKQRAVFEFIWDHTCERGYQPSFREVGRRFGITGTNGVAVHLRALAVKGWIDRRKGHVRGRTIKFLRCPDGRPFRGFVARQPEQEEPNRG